MAGESLAESVRRIQAEQARPEPSVESLAESVRRVRREQSTRAAPPEESLAQSVRRIKGEQSFKAKVPADAQQVTFGDADVPEIKGIPTSQRFHPNPREVQPQVSREETIRRLQVEEKKEITPGEVLVKGAIGLATGGTLPGLLATVGPAALAAGSGFAKGGGMGAIENVASLIGGGEVTLPAGQIAEALPGSISPGVAAGLDIATTLGTSLPGLAAGGRRALKAAASSKELAEFGRGVTGEVGEVLGGLRLTPTKKETAKALDAKVAATKVAGKTKTAAEEATERSRIEIEQTDALPAGDVVETVVEKTGARTQGQLDDLQTQAAEEVKQLKGVQDLEGTLGLTQRGAKKLGSGIGKVFQTLEGIDDIATKHPDIAKGFNQAALGRQNYENDLRAVIPRTIQEHGLQAGDFDSDIWDAAVTLRDTQSTIRRSTGAPDAGEAGLRHAMREAPAEEVEDAVRKFRAAQSVAAERPEQAAALADGMERLFARSWKDLAPEIRAGLTMRDIRGTIRREFKPLWDDAPKAIAEDMRQAAFLKSAGQTAAVRKGLAARPAQKALPAPQAKGALPPDLLLTQPGERRAPGTALSADPFVEGRRGGRQKAVLAQAKAAGLTRADVLPSAEIDKAELKRQVTAMREKLWVAMREAEIGALHVEGYVPRTLGKSKFFDTGEYNISGLADKASGSLVRRRKLTTPSAALRAAEGLVRRVPFTGSGGARIVDAYIHSSGRYIATSRLLRELATPSAVQKGGQTINISKFGQLVADDPLAAKLVAMKMRDFAGLPGADERLGDAIVKFFAGEALGPRPTRAAFGGIRSAFGRALLLGRFNSAAKQQGQVYISAIGTGKGLIGNLPDHLTVLPETIAQSFKLYLARTKGRLTGEMVDQQRIMPLLEHMPEGADFGAEFWDRLTKGPFRGQVLGMLDHLLGFIGHSDLQARAVTFNAAIAKGMRDRAGDVNRGLLSSDAAMELAVKQARDDVNSIHFRRGTLGRGALVQSQTLQTVGQFQVSFPLRNALLMVHQWPKQAWAAAAKGDKAGMAQAVRRVLGMSALYLLLGDDEEWNALGVDLFSPTVGGGLPGGDRLVRSVKRAVTGEGSMGDVISSLSGPAPEFLADVLGGRKDPTGEKFTAADFALQLAPGQAAGFEAGRLVSGVDRPFPRSRLRPTREFARIFGEGQEAPRSNAPSRTVSEDLLKFFTAIERPGAGRQQAKRLDVIDAIEQQKDLANIEVNRGVAAHLRGEIEERNTRLTAAGEITATDPSKKAAARIIRTFMPPILRDLMRNQVAFVRRMEGNPELGIPPDNELTLLINEAMASLASDMAQASEAQLGEFKTAQRLARDALANPTEEGTIAGGNPPKETP